MAIYQIREQTDLEIVLFPTTLEEATDVTYDYLSFNEVFNEGTSDSMWVRVRGWWGTTSDTIHYVNMSELLRRVKLAMVAVKEYVPPLTAETLECLGCNQSTFKENGYMLHPSKGVFVRWKARPKKVVISKDLINRLRNFCNEAVARYVVNQYKFGFKLESCANKKDQVRVLKFGHDLGFTWDIFMEMEACGYTGHYIPEQGKYVFISKTVPVWLREQLANRGEEQMYDATIAEFKKWFDDSLVAVEDEG